MELIADSVDLSRYMGDERVAAKVHPASTYGQLLKSEFRARAKPHAQMTSTKLRTLLDFAPGEVTVWAGYNGHRKSMFTGQVALDLCEQRERVLIASLEMLPARTLARMARQASASSQPAELWLDAFSRWTDDRLWVFDHLGRITPQMSMAVCRYFADEHRGTHVFIDSMMMICASEDQLDEQKQFMTDLVRMVKETGLHAHLVAHCRKPSAGEDKPPERYDIRGSAAIADQCDNIVTVWQNRQKKAKLEVDNNDQAALQQPDCVISVCKQRHGRFEGKLQMWFHEPSMRFMDNRIDPVRPYDIEAPHARPWLADHQ